MGTTPVFRHLVSTVLMACARNAPQREKLTQGIEGALCGRHVSHDKMPLWLERRHSMKETSVVRSDPDVLGGTPVFVGTRVPVQALIDYIEGGHSLSAFLPSLPKLLLLPSSRRRPT